METEYNMVKLLVGLQIQKEQCVTIFEIRSAVDDPQQKCVGTRRDPTFCLDPNSRERDEN